MIHRCFIICLIVFGGHSLCIAEGQSWEKAFPEAPQKSRIPNRRATIGKMDIWELKKLSSERDKHEREVGEKKRIKDANGKMIKWGYDIEKYETLPYDAFLAAHEMARRFLKDDKDDEALAVLAQDKLMEDATPVYRAIIYEHLEKFDEATMVLKKSVPEKKEDEYGKLFVTHIDPITKIGDGDIHTCLAIIHMTGGQEFNAQYLEGNIHIIAAESRRCANGNTPKGMKLEEVKKRFEKHEHFPDNPTLIADFFFSKPSK